MPGVAGLGGLGGAVGVAFPSFPSCLQAPFLPPGLEPRLPALSAAGGAFR